MTEVPLLGPIQWMPANDFNGQVLPPSTMVKSSFRETTWQVMGKIVELPKDAWVTDMATGRIAYSPVIVAIACWHLFLTTVSELKVAVDPKEN